MPSFILWILLLSGCSLADQIVYLERNITTAVWEPHFFPTSVNASIGEKITFVARLDAILAYTEGIVV